MKLRTALIVLGVLFGLAVGASTAQAAKGVKKNPKGGVHIHHGVVTHVDHKNGHFTILGHHHSKKKKATAGTTTPQSHHFKVHGGTKFAAHQGKNHSPSSFTALRTGEHVTVSSKKGTAETVVIHASGKKKKAKKK